MPTINTLKWWDGQKWRPILNAVNAVAEPPTGGKAVTTLTLSVPTSRNGSGTITLTATLKSGTVALATKAIQFQVLIGSTWTNIGSTVNTNGSGVATTTYTIGSTSQFRAQFAGDASYVASTSSTQTTQVKTLQQFTKRFTASWAGNYKANGDQDTGWGDVLWQSFDASWANYTNYKALWGFNYTSIQNFLNGYVDPITCTVSLYVGSVFTSDPSNSVVILGTHNYGAKPTGAGAVSMANVDEDLGRHNLTITKAGNARETWDLSNTNRDTFISTFASGAAKGLAVGPSPTTPPPNKFILSFVGPGQQDTWIEFTVTKWA